MIKKEDQLKKEFAEAVEKTLGDLKRIEKFRADALEAASDNKNKGYSQAAVAQEEVASALSECMRVFRSQQQLIAALERRIADLENPPVVFLDKGPKPPAPASPE